MKRLTAIMTPLILILAVGVGCEYYNERPNGIQPTQPEGITQVTESETIKDLKTRIIDLQNQLADQPPPAQDQATTQAVQDLQNQIADLQRQLGEAGAADTPEEGTTEGETTESGSTADGPSPTADTTSSPEATVEPAVPATGSGVIPMGDRIGPGPRPVSVIPSSEACVPPTYSDGRTAVPLVITAYGGKNFEGKKARFVKDTTNVAMSTNINPPQLGGISSLLIQRGPNYVEGDKVKVNGGPTGPGLLGTLGPGHYMDLATEGFDDKIVSLTIERSPDLSTKVCADGPGTEDALAWDEPIRLVVDIIISSSYSIEGEQIIKDIGILENWGSGLQGAPVGSPGHIIKRLTLSKGPHYQDGDNVVLHQEYRAQGRSSIPLSMTESSRLYRPLGTYESPYRTAVPTEGLSYIGSIYFHQRNGNTIYFPADAE